MKTTTATPGQEWPNGNPQIVATGYVLASDPSPSRENDYWRVYPMDTTSRHIRRDWPGHDRDGMPRRIDRTDRFLDPRIRRVERPTSIPPYTAVRRWPGFASGHPEAADD